MMKSKVKESKNVKMEIDTKESFREVKEMVKVTITTILGIDMREIGNKIE